MVFEGFKFGMLLQIAIGPVCMYIFSLGTTERFLIAESGVLGVVLADGIYIVLAILGISSFIKKESLQKKFNILGALIVIVFGIELFLSYFSMSILPNFNIFKGMSSASPFFKAFLLTAANPMTILFWIGVFSTKLNSGEMSRKNSSSFALGALFATLFFLTLIAFLGSVTTEFLSKNLMSILNSLVGAILIYFGIKKLLKK